MTTSAIRLAVQRYAPGVKDAIRAVRCRLTGRAQGDPYLTPIAKSILSYSPSRSAAIEHVLAFVIDAAWRGDLADAEQLGRELQGIARVEYERRHPSMQLTLAEAHAAEQRAEGIKNDAETALIHARRADGTYPRAEIVAFLAADAVYDVAARRLGDTVRRLDAEVCR
jgi:hypothetical protein